MGSLNPAPQTVLYLHSGQNWIRGSERILLDLATSLPRAKYRPLVWCDSDVLRSECDHCGLQVLQHPFPSRADQPWWRTPPAAIRDTLSVIRESNAALLHVNALYCLPWALCAARVAHLPVLAHLHLPTTEEERIWSGLHQVTRAVGVSRFSLAWAHADGFPATATRLIYNAVFPARLEKGDATRLRADLGIPPDAFVAVTVGSLIPRKAISTVIEGVSRVASTGADIHLLILGTGEERARLEAQARGAGVDHRVHFLGDRPDVGAILRDAADALISAANAETLGLNVIEAGYFGVPTIVSDIPPHREIVDHAESGLLFELNDPEDLAHQLTTLLTDSHLRDALGRRARQKVDQRFRADRFVRDFIQLYDEMVAFPRWRLGGVIGFRFPTCYWRLGWGQIRKVWRKTS